jgi:hypothetical protein
VTALSPAPDATPADWVVAGLGAFGDHDVVSLLPAGFSSYVRVFHPAAQDGRSVRWAEIAQANGTHAHPEMQLNAITRHAHPRARPQPGIFDEEPEWGSLPGTEAATLVAILARQTTTADRCWFGIWSGFHGLAEATGAPTFGTEFRQYHLLTGPIEAAAATADRFDRLGHQAANLWWPDDRAWCVATDIDLDSTYVGCDEACERALLASELEAAAIRPSAGIDAFSDSINPSSPTAV